LYFVSKNSLHYSGDKFHSVEGYDGHVYEGYGYFTDIVFGDIPRIKLECPV